jgi:hypothetical protein
MSAKSYTGTCLCNAVTYRIDLPDSTTPKVLIVTLQSPSSHQSFTDLQLVS